MFDGLSPLGVNILDANPHAYERLVVEGGTPALARELLDKMQPEQLLSRPAASPVAAFAMLAGLWLWHDGLEECHRIVQKSPQELYRAALNLHSKTSKMYATGGSVEFMESDKASNYSDLQNMASTFSFWHAIMHRREGDFSNSKYWYARTSGHPAFATLAAAAGPIVNQAPADKLLLRLVSNGWNPNLFVDLVEEVSNRPDDSRQEVVVTLQRLEWKTLFDYCAR